METFTLVWSWDQYESFTITDTIDGQVNRVNAVIDPAGEGTAVWSIGPEYDDERVYVDVFTADEVWISAIVPDDLAAQLVAAAGF